MTELGRIDIITEVSLLSSHLALPREGCWDSAMNVMANAGQKFWHWVCCQGMNILRGLRYELRMMDIPISDPSYIYRENMFVVYNTFKPESVLTNQNQYLQRKATQFVIMQYMILGSFLGGHLPSSENVADLMTKIFYGQWWQCLVGNILNDFQDDHGVSVIQSLGPQSGKFDPIDDNQSWRE